MRQAFIFGRSDLMNPIDSSIASIQLDNEQIVLIGTWGLVGIVHSGTLFHETGNVDQVPSIAFVSDGTTIGRSLAQASFTVRRYGKMFEPFGRQAFQFYLGDKGMRRSFGRLFGAISD